MKKVVYNSCHGGFSLSKIAAIWLAGRGHEEAIKWLAESNSEVWSENFYSDSLARHSALLVECVETLADKANGSFSDLLIAEVEDLYRIEEYDGLEHVVQPQEEKWISAVRDPDLMKEKESDHD